MVLMNPSAGSKEDADTNNRLVDMGEEGGGGTS